MLLLLSVGSVSLLAGKKYQIDYDKTTDFTKFETYAWVPGTPVIDPRIDAYIKNSVADVLNRSGLTETTFGKADLLVTYHAAVGMDISIGTAIDPTYAASGGIPAPGQSVWQLSGAGISTYVRKGSLTFLILDKAANRPIWTGTASDTVSDKLADRWKQVQKALDGLFRDYPPAKPAGKSS
jgi:hypothetical protein